MRIRLLIAMLALFVLLVGCTKDEGKAESDKTTDDPVVEKEETPDQPEGKEEFKHVYPLTGIATNEPVDNRIVGVMVNNHTKARPQTGLSHADIVYEILAEGMITRFLALFQSDMPEVVGPVRSAREYFFELADGNNAIYVYHGAAGFVNQMIYDRGIEYIDGFFHDNDGELFKRASFRQAPHNSYLQMGAVYDEAKEQGYAVTATYELLPFLNEEELDDVSGAPAQHVEIDYSVSPIMEIVEFDYDASKGKYTRFNDREKTVELDTNEPIQVDNVFIVETHHEVIDDVGRRAVDIESGGDALLIQKGKVKQVKWENKDGRIIPVKDGQPVGFVPGQTWINIIPKDPGIDGSVTISN